MNFDDAAKLLGEYVRVWDGPRSTIRARGRVVAVIPSPVLVIEGDHGERWHETTDLPVEVSVWESRG